MRVIILTISDSVSQGATQDRSGPAVRERCLKLGWEVLEVAVLPDERGAIEARLRALADGHACDLLLTTGGTGLGPRDVTPEATLAVAERLIPGFGERMRTAGYARTPRALLSRAVAALRGRTLILNLPGSPGGAVESLDAVAELLPHAVEIIHGARHH